MDTFDLEPFAMTLQQRVALETQCRVWLVSQQSALPCPNTFTTKSRGQCHMTITSIILSQYLQAERYRCLNMLTKPRACHAALLFESSRPPGAITTLPLTVLPQRFCLQAVVIFSAKGEPRPRQRRGLEPLTRITEGLCPVTDDAIRDNAPSVKAKRAGHDPHDHRQQL